MCQNDSIGAVFFGDGKHTVHPIVSVAIEQGVGAHDEGQLTEVELVEADHSGDGVFRVVAHRIGARGDFTVEDDGDAFVFGSCHLLGCENDGVLLSILDGFGGNDVIGVVANRHGTSLNFGCHIAVVVLVATGADQGQATEEHQT